MFERFTEPARRTLFFARYETTQLGHLSIEPEHLLLGLLRDMGAVSWLFTTAGMHLDAVRTQVEERLPSRAVVPTSVETPFAASTVRVLKLAEEEANALSQKQIGNGHLLAGLLRDEQTLAADLLRSYGVKLRAVREFVASQPAEPEDFVPPSPGAILTQITRIQEMLGRLPEAAPGNREVIDILFAVHQELEALKGRFGL